MESGLQKQASADGARAAASRSARASAVFRNAAPAWPTLGGAEREACQIMALETGRVAVADTIEDEALRELAARGVG